LERFAVMNILGVAKNRPPTSTWFTVYRMTDTNEHSKTSPPWVGQLHLTFAELIDCSELRRTAVASPQLDVGGFPRDLLSFTMATSGCQRRCSD
jgi:hypothetical protein